MNSNEEIVSSLCDRIMAVCNRINKRLDENDKYHSSYDGHPDLALPYVTSWCPQTGHQPWQTEYNATDHCVGELRLLPPPEPDPPYAEPYEQPHLSLHPPYTGPDQYAQPQYSADGYQPWKPEYQPSRLYSGLDSYARPRDLHINYHQLQHAYQPSQPIPPQPPPSDCFSATLLPTIASPPPLPVTAPSLASNLQQRAVVPVSMEKVNSDLGTNVFYPKSLNSLNFATKNICFAENAFDEKVINSKKNSERFSSCGEITLVHEISEGVKHEREGCSSSSLGERLIPEEIHKFDNILIHVEANSDDDDVYFQSICDPQTRYSNVPPTSLGDTSENMSHKEIKEMSFIDVKVHNQVADIGDDAIISHRSTTLDTDARLIPPRDATSCLGIHGHIDKSPVLELNHEHDLRARQVEGVSEVLQTNKLVICHSSIEPRPKTPRQKTALSTLTQSGSAIQRRKAAKEVGPLKQVYGTSRSVWFAEKSAKFLLGVTGLLKKDLVIDDVQNFKRNLEESLDKTLEDSIHISTKFLEMENLYSSLTSLGYDIFVDVALGVKWIPGVGYKNLKVVAEIDKEIDAQTAAEPEPGCRHKALGDIFGGIATSILFSLLVMACGRTLEGELSTTMALNNFLQGIIPWHWSCCYSSRRINKSIG